jgi:ADP-heptose:LPS heptosyltransferase
MASLFSTLKHHLIQFAKEQILYRLPPHHQDENTVLLLSLEGIGDYILLRNFLPYLRNWDFLRHKKLIFVGNAALKDFIKTYDAPLFDQTIWVNFEALMAMSLYQRWLFLRDNIRIHRAATLILPTHSRLDIEDLFVIASGAQFKIASAGDETRLGANRKARSDRRFQKLIPCLPTTVFQFERNRHFFQNLIGKPIPISRTNIEVNTHSKNPQLISLYIGASQTYRQWSVAHFAALAQLIYTAYPHCQFQILGAPYEVPLAEKLRHLLPHDFPITSQCGKTGLIDLVTEIARSRLLISNETSGPHFAAALDTDCICISNGNHFGRFHPYPLSMTDRILTVYPTDDFLKPENFETLSHQYRRWEDSIQLSDINSIAPERVFTAFEKLWNS